MEAHRDGRSAAANPGDEISVVLESSLKGYQVLPSADIHSSRNHIKMLIWFWQRKGWIA
jgi:hypothetical protein